MQTDDNAIEKQKSELEKLRSMIRGYFGKLCHDAEVAENLTQEALYQARLSLSDFRGEYPLSAWLLEIANQLLKEHFEGEIEKLRSMIRGYLGKRCQDAEVAESLTQETLYQACRSLPQFRGDCPLSAWVQKIAANLWKKHLERDPYQTGKVISHDFTQPQEDSSAQGQQKPSVQGPENQVLSALLVQQFLQEMSHCCSPEESYVISTHWQGTRSKRSRTT